MSNTEYWGLYIEIQMKDQGMAVFSFAGGRVQTHNIMKGIPKCCICISIYLFEKMVGAAKNVISLTG